MRKFLVNNKYWLAVFLILVVFIALRLPSLVEPHWYNDEGIYAAVASQLAQGDTLYLGAWDHKPPGIILIYSAANVIANWLQVDQLFLLRVVNIGFGIATLLLLARLAKKIFNSKSALIALTIAALILGSIFFEGNLFNAENIFIVFTLAAFSLSYEIIASKKLLSAKISLVIGLLFGLAIFTKFQPALELAGLIFIISAFAWQQKLALTKLLRNIALLMFGALTPYSLAALYYLSLGQLNEFIFANFSYNFSYASSPELAVGLPLTLKLMIVAVIGVLVCLSFYKRWINSKLFFMSVWFLAALAGTALSSRPFAHYLLQISIPAAILSVISAEYIVQALKNKAKQAIVSVILGLLCLFSAGVVIDVKSIEFGYIRPQQSYYIEGYKYLLTGDSTAWDSLYITPEAELALLSSIITDYGKDIWFWEDNSWYIALNQLNWPVKYVVRFHIKDWNAAQVISDLSTAEVKIIVVDTTLDIPITVMKYIEQNYELIETRAEYNIFSR